MKIDWNDWEWLDDEYKPLEHDRCWNWNVRSGEIIRCNESHGDLIEDENYEVVVPQGTPNGIVVKQLWKTNRHFVGEHSWFSKI